ncbi:hybrid sensor histidine kinase/response regulator [Mariniblastus fucicola]|nr:response regulator [Mariniblastus fucicola]
MPQTLVFDFTDLPQHSIDRQVTSTEQIAILCGLNRRTSRRLGKTVFLILSDFPPETLLENSVRFTESDLSTSLEFNFSTRPQEIAAANNATDKKLGSLRRAGEKFANFRLTGSPDEGFEIQFSEQLPVGFEIPQTRILKNWARVVTKGDWEEAFGLLSKSYNRNRTSLHQLRDRMLIRKEVLGKGSEQAEAILSLVASKSDNPVLILDSVGVAEWTNRAFYKLSGIEVDESNRLSAFSLLFGERTGGDAATEFEKSLTLGRTFSLEYSWTPIKRDEHHDGPDHDPIWIEFQVTPVRDENEKVVRWIAIGADITKRRQAELAMLAAKEVAESANRAKSDFLAMMSHEIRTPMNAIIGMTELTLGTQLTIDQRECLTTANNSAQSLLQILNDILDLSKVEAQRLELEQADFNVADVTRETLDTLGVLAQRKSLALRCNFPLDIHQQLVGDSMRLRQVLVNLVGNAIKFTSFGHVDVNVELLDETNDEISLHYAVQDTGPGIPESKTSRIFEAFFQSDTSVTRNFGGTGLGLAITSELIRLMGGRIWVESKLGKGSTFHFVVTFKKSNRTFVSLSPDAGKQLAGKKILVIDNNEANQNAIGRWMNHWGVETEFAFSGNEGKRVLHENARRYDLAIVDAVLPDIDGFAVVESLLEPESNNTTPVLMFSSDDRNATIERCRELGVQAWLIKPVSPKTLFSSIQLTLGTDQNSLAGLANGTSGGDSIERSNVCLNVLVVDDHASNRKLIGEILRRRGHQWREAADGAGALALIVQEEFDVVLMDVQMPEKDGLAVTAEIRDLPNEKAVLPIIAVTAYVTEEDRQRCLDASMDDYLSKPVSVKDLIEKVERWGNTVRSDFDLQPDESLDNQLLIQDAPDWATQITQAIVVAEESTDTDEKQIVATGETAQAAASGVAMEPFAEALERFGGDQELLRMQISFFLAETPDLIQSIEKAIHDRDGKALHHNAHRLKGLVRTYDDELAAELTGKLEEMGRANSFDDAESTLVLLASRVQDLSQRLERCHASFGSS